MPANDQIFAGKQMPAKYGQFALLHLAFVIIDIFLILGKAIP